MSKKLRDILDKVIDTVLLIGYPIYLLKWKIFYWREKRKLYKVEQWKLMLYGYKTCMFYRNWEEGNEVCTRKLDSKLNCFFGNVHCDKYKCKVYINDPIKC
jgi:hypothetical protein